MVLIGDKVSLTYYRHSNKNIVTKMEAVDLLGFRQFNGEPEEGVIASINPVNKWAPAPFLKCEITIRNNKNIFVENVMSYKKNPENWKPKPGDRVKITFLEIVPSPFGNCYVYKFNKIERIGSDSDE